MPEIIIRPNGKQYRPRKGLRQLGFSDYDQFTDYVVVLGTHDIEKARAFASPYRCAHLVEPRLVWVKKTIRDGEPYIDTSATTDGAAAVQFREADDPEETNA